MCPLADPYHGTSVLLQIHTVAPVLLQHHVAMHLCPYGWLHAAVHLPPGRVTLQRICPLKAQHQCATVPLKLQM